MTDPSPHDLEEAAARRALNRVSWMLTDEIWAQPLPWRQRWRVVALALFSPQMVVQYAYLAVADKLNTIDPAQFRTDRSNKP